MSEKNAINAIPEIIFTDGDSVPMPTKCRWYVGACTIKSERGNTPYILKSKYDEQAAEIEKLKAELEKVRGETAKKDCVTYIPDFMSSGATCMICGKSQAFHPQL